MKHHSKGNECVPATTNITNNIYNNIYNKLPSVSTSHPRKRSNEESEINEEELRKVLNADQNEYQRNLDLGKAI